MNQNNIGREDLAIGMEVEINPQSDRTRSKRIKGEIVDILTNAETHPHGILVLLKNGERGRVKNILSQMGSHRKNHDNTPTFSHQPESEEKTLEDIILAGEDNFIEFKTSMLWSLKLSGDELNKSGELKKHGRNTSKFIIAKTLAGFLNSDGGNLILGVKENKNDQLDEIVGIESEFPKLQDPCVDGYRRMIIDAVIKQYFPSYIFNHLNSYLRIRFEEIKGKTVCGISALKSDQKVFLKTKEKDLFFIRVDASTREIHGEAIVDYCTKRFN